MARGGSRKAKKRALRGLPPLPETPRVKWTCPICGTDKNKSRHHIEPQRLRNNNARSNLDPICRPCHDQVERAYNAIIAHTFPILWAECKHRSVIERNLAYLHYELIAGRDTVPQERWTLTGLPPDVPIEVVLVRHAAARERTLAANRVLYEACLALDWDRIYACVKWTLASRQTPAHPDSSYNVEDPFYPTPSFQGDLDDSTTYQQVLGGVRDRL